MPEGPEVHMAARFINEVAKHHKLGGKIVKSAVSTKNPNVDFSASLYNIHAESRGKELKVFLSDSENIKKKNPHFVPVWNVWLLQTDHQGGSTQTCPPEILHCG